MRFFSQNNLPDIDELVQKWLDRLFQRGKRGRGGHEAFGSSNGDGGSPPSGEGFSLPPMRLITVLLGSLVILLYLFVGFFTVDANEQAVMFRLGKPTGVRGPGLKWHIPLVEDYRIVNVSEVQRVEVGYRNDTNNKNPNESLMLTDNLNIIDMQFVVQYALNNAERFLFENRFTNRRAEDVVKQVAETSMREIVGRSSIDFVLYEGREAIADEARRLMQDILDNYKSGIEVRQVAIQNVQPPDQVQDAFEDAIKARQDRERKINEGQAYANDILPRSRGQAARVLEDAQAYQESVIVRSEGEADRFLLLAQEYVAAPAITRRRLYLETMEEVMQRANKVVIDEGNNNNLLYLPLDKMIGAGAARLPEIMRQDSDDANQPPTAKDIEAFKNYLRRQGQSAVGALRDRQ